MDKTDGREDLCAVQVNSDSGEGEGKNRSQVMVTGGGCASSPHFPGGGTFVPIRSSVLAGFTSFCVADRVV